MCLKICLFLIFSLSIAQGSKMKKQQQDEEWNYRDGSNKVNLRGVANLTEVLDNWRYDIVMQIKNLLLSDHQAILPDYSRIPLLSEAVDDLFKEFNALKERLGELSEKFMNIEAFIDDVKSAKASDGGQLSPRQAGELTPDTTPVLEGMAPAKPRGVPKKKVIVPKKKKVDLA